jgi:hypothetical protein
LCRACITANTRVRTSQGCCTGQITANALCVQSGFHSGVSKECMRSFTLLQPHNFHSKALLVYLHVQTAVCTQDLRAAKAAPQHGVRVTKSALVFVCSLAVDNFAKRACQSKATMAKSICCNAQMQQLHLSATLEYCCAAAHRPCCHACCMLL